LGGGEGSGLGSVGAQGGHARGAWARPRRRTRRWRPRCARWRPSRRLGRGGGTPSGGGWRRGSGAAGWTTSCEGRQGGPGGGCFGRRGGGWGGLCWGMGGHARGAWARPRRRTRRWRPRCARWQPPLRLGRGGGTPSGGSWRRGRVGMTGRRARALHGGRAVQVGERCCVEGEHVQVRHPGACVRWFDSITVLK
jgi:hypothetical protein